MKAERVIILKAAAAIIGVIFYLVLTGLTPATVVQAQRSGAAVYSQNCARCHGSDGRGQTAKGRQLGAADLTGPDWTPNTARDTRIVTRGKGSMPAFKGKLSAAEISAVVAYIRRFKN